MSDTAWIVLALSLVTATIVLVMGRQLGWLRFKLFGTSSVTAGARKNEATAEKAKAKGNINVTNEGGGRASANSAQAGEDITVTNK